MAESFLKPTIITDPVVIQKLKDEMKKPPTAFLDVEPFEYPVEEDCREIIEEWLSR